MRDWSSILGEALEQRDSMLGTPGNAAISAGRAPSSHSERFFVKDPLGSRGDHIGLCARRPDDEPRATIGDGLRVRKLSIAASGIVTIGLPAARGSHDGAVAAMGNHGVDAIERRRGNEPLETNPIGKTCEREGSTLLPVVATTATSSSDAKPSSMFSGAASVLGLESVDRRFCGGFVSDAGGGRTAVTQDHVLSAALTQFPGKQITVFIGNFEPGASVPLHRHPGTELLFVLEGEGVMNIEGGEARELKKGEAVLVSPEAGAESFTHQVLNTDASRPMKNLVVVIHGEGSPAFLPG